MYIVLLDASKTFDKVSFYTLFNRLFDKERCPRTVKVLYYMYTNQSYYVTWSSNRSETLNDSLNCIYIDNLFLELRTGGLGCCQTLQILGLDHVYFNTLKFTSVYYYFDFGYRILLIIRFVFCLIPFNFMEVIIVSITYFAILTFI